ncbi:uracil phosphoribosyltransferase-domain-containing protein [Glomus cerebriforme]|uniref:Uridine kinase n=1 Tax=Glomus cerebriforme TaxID=658196 RepID=A0A397TQ81_9GLOM|nr:uracil phosphoribosyltransferase-domain-containing protein [Glomus cerebriforme]
MSKNNVFLRGEGRSPWYRLDGSKFDCYLVGVAGGSASGKTSVAVRIIENLNVPWVVLLSMDSFYNVLSPEKKIDAQNNNFNFDHPDAFDFNLLLDTLKNLKEGKRVEVPIYDFVTHSRLPQKNTLYGANVVIFEGILALYDQRIIDLMDLKVFVDTDSDIRLIRRLKRDISERGRDLNGVIQQYENFVKPAFDQYIQPTVKNADVIVPRGLDNLVAIDLITKHIQRQLHERQFNFRWDLVKIDCNGKEIPENVIVLDQTPQLKGIHTIIRDRNTQRDDFIFYSERLAAIVVERALSELMFIEHEIITPLDIPYLGKKCIEQICGVSILRAGSTMETGLRRVVKDTLIGKILIQSHPKTGEPSLHFINLPNNICECYVLLMDAQIATGAAALMAIRVLLDHDVPEAKIIFLTFLATPLGLHVISKAFPKVKICTSMIDPKINDETLFIEPGMGNFGDRYYGTS